VLGDADEDRAVAVQLRRVVVPADELEVVRHVHAVPVGAGDPEGELGKVARQPDEVVEPVEVLAAAADVPQD